MLKINKAGCRHSHVLQSPTRARHKSPSDLRWIRVMEIQASHICGSHSRDTIRAVRPDRISPEVKPIQAPLGGGAHHCEPGDVGNALSRALVFGASRNRPRIAAVGLCGDAQPLIDDARVGGSAGIPTLEFHTISQPLLPPSGFRPDLIRG